MPAYVIDTNLYLRATRSTEWSRQLEAFFIAFAPWVHLHSIVALEVLAGALNPDLKRKTQERFIKQEPFIKSFERRGRASFEIELQAASYCASGLIHDALAALPASHRCQMAIGPGDEGSCWG
ncbi:hypothetical protein BH23GEM7_BH23GEM7_15020 [soil metagenome]|nr:hypothetical protein [Gemmatimonadota bacterium]